MGTPHGVLKQALIGEKHGPDQTGPLTAPDSKEDRAQTGPESVGGQMRFLYGIIERGAEHEKGSYVPQLYIAHNGNLTKDVPQLCIRLI